MWLYRRVSSPFLKESTFIIPDLSGDKTIPRGCIYCKRKELVPKGAIFFFFLFFFFVEKGAKNEMELAFPKILSRIYYSEMCHKWPSGLIVLYSLENFKLAPYRLLLFHVKYLCFYISILIRHFFIF